MWFLVFGVPLHAAREAISLRCYIAITIDHPENPIWKDTPYLLRRYTLSHPDSLIRTGDLEQAICVHAGERKNVSIQEPV